MGEMEEKLNSILNNPQMMRSIMSMAQSLGQDKPAPGEEKSESTASFPDIDLSLLPKLANLAGESSIDSDQQALLNALSPFLSRSRVMKLEKAMRAARMARMASAFLNSGGLQFLTGR